MIRADVRPELLRWARERAGLSVSALERRFPALEDWEQGNFHPTLKQLERFAKATYTPVGYLFLPEPPVETVPIPDFRTVGAKATGRPSPNLLDTIYVCQQRQEWYRDYARTAGEDARTFVGSVQMTSDIVQTAARMRQWLEFDVDQRARMPTWTEALRLFIGRADAQGVLVMCSGVVLNNNHRALDPEEFRGFAIADDYAPLVFINGADTKAAQMFTLAHELAHIWLGSSALSDAHASEVPEPAEAVESPERDVEQWCNKVARSCSCRSTSCETSTRSATNCPPKSPAWHDTSR